MIMSWARDRPKGEERNCGTPVSAINYACSMSWRDYQRAPGRLCIEEAAWQTLLRHTGFDVRACPRCKTGRLLRYALTAQELARSPPVAS
jgi:hypothetical protein